MRRRSDPAVGRSGPGRQLTRKPRPATQSLRLVRATLGQGAGLVGAAMIVVSQILQAAVLDDYLTTRAAQQHFTSSIGARKRQPA